MRIIIPIAAILAILAACTTDTAQLEAHNGVTKLSHDFNRNYQAVYRDLASTASRCEEVTLTSNASVIVDRELYTELGMGEVTRRLSNWGVNDFTWKAEVRKTGANTSNVTIWAKHPVVANRTLGWASGATGCSA